MGSIFISQMKIRPAPFLVLAATLAAPLAHAQDDAMSPLTAGVNGPAISQKDLTNRWWCRGMVCVSSLPAEGDVCAAIDRVNKGPCHPQEKAHVLRAFDAQQGAEVILVLSSAPVCARQLRRWKKDSNLQNPTCEVSTPAAFFGVEVSDQD